MALTEEQQQLLRGLESDYEEQVLKNMNAQCKPLASLRFENNKYYLETVVREFSVEEIKKLFVSEIVGHLVARKHIKADGIEIGRASDAVKILQHYILTRKDVC